MSTSVSQHIIIADYEAVKVILKSGNVNLVHIQAAFSDNHRRGASLVNYLLIYTHTIYSCSSRYGQFKILLHTHWKYFLFYIQVY